VALTYKDVADILKIIDASKLDEIVIEMDGVKLQVRRGANGQPSLAPVAAAAPALPSASAPGSIQSPRAATNPAANPSASQLAGHAVRSPMVGTFYRAPSPNDPPFVEVGRDVKRGDTLCLIEVMKLFTTITADQDGRVAHILPGNGDLVEFDQILFVIDPA
jgi:acetyl-CoA carboxylase biotin carboxyl carrier protein